MIKPLRHKTDMDGYWETVISGLSIFAFPLALAVMVCTLPIYFLGKVVEWLATDWRKPE